MNSVLELKPFLRNSLSFESLPPMRLEGQEPGLNVHNSHTFPTPQRPIRATPSLPLCAQSGAANEADVQGECSSRNSTGTHLPVHKCMFFLDNLAQGHCQTELNINNEKNVSLWLNMANSIHASPLHPETPLKKEQ